MTGTVPNARPNSMQLPRHDIADIAPDGQWPLTTVDQLQAVWPDACFRSTGSRPWQGVFARRSLPHTRIEGILKAAPYRCVRGPEDVARTPDEAITINVVLAGRLTFEQHGHRFTAETDSVFLHRSGAYEYETSGTSSVMRTVLAPALALGRPDALLDLTGARPPTPLTTAFIRLAEELLRSTDDLCQLSLRTTTALEQALLVLQQAIIDEATLDRIDEPAPAQVLHVRALEHISRHLADPDLSASSIATALQVSRRSLFAAFASSPESLAQTIRRERVTSATRRLAATSDISVRQLAIETGFHSRDQLSRSFRALHGVTIAHYRRTIDPPSTPQP